MRPENTSQWTLDGQSGTDSLTYRENVELPKLGDEDVLVKIHAASLNYRDLAIASGKLSLLSKPHVVPGSDGAGKLFLQQMRRTTTLQSEFLCLRRDNLIMLSGTVSAIGAAVKDFSPGDRVCTHMIRQHPDDEPVTLTKVSEGLGSYLDGTFRQYGVFHETNLVHAPANASFEEASTLTCSALTAWNALFGLLGKQVKKGNWVLTQGTGGVSVAALQFAIAAGARVVATTSSDEKGVTLKELGAEDVINYKADTNWGESARALTPDGRGFDHVVDIGGQSTLGQSLKAVRVDGVVTIAGVLGAGEAPTLLDLLWAPCTARGVVLGSRTQFVEMNNFIEMHGVKLVVDERDFGFDQVREAYTYMQEQKHISKVVVRVA